MIAAAPGQRPDDWRRRRSPAGLTSGGTG